MLRERDRLFERDEHVDHPVLQHLKAPESNPELLARFAVFKRRGIQHRHRTDCFRAESGDSPVTARFERHYAFSFDTKHLADRYFHVHQRQFGGAPTIDGLEALQVKIDRMAIYNKQAHAVAIAGAAGRSRRYDQLVGPWRADHRSFGSAQDKLVSLAACSGGDVVEIIT